MREDKSSNFLEEGNDHHITKNKTYIKEKISQCVVLFNLWNIPNLLEVESILILHKSHQQDPLPVAAAICSSGSVALEQVP